MGIFNQLNTNIPKLQGNLGVHRAVYEYSKLGYTILWPLCDSAKYDLVIEKNGIFSRVQVKTSRTNVKYWNKRNNGSINETVNNARWVVNLVTSGGNTKVNKRVVRCDSDYDILFILVANGKCWSINSEHLHARSTMIVCEEKYI